MALYMTTSSTIKIATSSTLAELLCSRSLTMTEAADHEESANHFMEVADSVSGQAVPFGGLTTCKCLLVVTDRQITVNINGSEAVVVGHTVDEAAHLLLPATSLTSLTIDNASGAQANVYIAMAGV